MIEKLARVLANETEADWKAMPLLHKLVFRSSARACLEALREPSEAMISAVAGRAVLPTDNERQRQRDLVRKDWQSMIDVALERKAA